MDATALLLGILAGLIVGGGAAWAVATRGRADAVAAAIAGRQEAHAGALATARAEADHQRAAVAALQSRLDTLQHQHNEMRASYEARLSAATARAEEAQRNVEEQKKLLAQAEAKLLETFKAAGVEALSLNSKQFLELAKAKFEELKKEQQGDLAKRQEAIQGLVKPMGETLAKYEGELKKLEEKRVKAYTQLEETLKSLGEAQKLLQKETSTLSNALRNPTVRGRWGEMTLQRAAELAGMVENQDYEMQASFDGEDGRQRPDMIVRLPAGRTIAVDSKVPLDAYLDYLAAATEEARQVALQRHAKAFKSHLNTLTNKAYWKQFSPAPEFVIMFVPGEPFLAAAVEAEPTLIQQGAEGKVILSTPSTLIATLLAVAHGWRQHQLAENAEEIRKLGATLYERLVKFGSAFADTGKALRKTVDAYNTAVGSYDGRLAVTARKFQELGVAAQEELPGVEPVDREPRRVEVQEAAPLQGSGPD